MSNNRGLRQSLLGRHISQTITNSRMTLDALHDATGINRAKLGRMRLGKGPVTFDEAEAIFRATRRPGRAIVMLACLGEERVFTRETLAYLDQFLSALPSLLDQLNELGPTLNPKWAHGSALHIGALMAEHADRLVKAETFLPPVRGAA